MRFVYRNLNADDLRGSSVAELLVNVEANLQIIDDGRVIYEERAFPVLELARELVGWTQSACAEERDFEFVSLSFEETGAVRIRRSSEGWLVGSVFEPELVSRPIRWKELSEAVNSLAANLRRDLGQLGIGAWLIPDLSMRGEREVTVPQAEIVM